MKRYSSLIALGGVAALALAACSSEEEGASGAIDVVTSVYPLEYVAEQVGGDHVNVTSLTPPGSDDHALELSPRQVTSLEAVDLVITLSNYQAAMDEAVDATGPAHLIDAADYVDLVDVSAHAHDDHVDEHDHDAHDHSDHEHADEEHADEHGTEVEEDHDHHGHSHAGPDPHFWLDPIQVSKLAHPVADQLAEIDPENADEYRANADELVASLEALDMDFHEGLSQCTTSTFVVSHEAFGYLATAYDLDQQAIAGIEIDTEPSPRRVAEITTLIEDAGVTVIFATSQAEMTLASALAEEAGVEVDILDAGATQVDDEIDYDGLMRNNLSKLQESMGCE